DLIVTGVQTCALPILSNVEDDAGVTRLSGHVRGQPEDAPAPPVRGDAPTVKEDYKEDYGKPVDVYTESMRLGYAQPAANAGKGRSEERRVGKEGRGRR